MAKFSKPEGGVVTSTGTHNVLASGTVIKGDIFAEENFRVDGTIEGTIKCKGKIVVGPQSRIKGNIECVNIEVLGNIEGNIVCSDTLVLRSTANIIGDVSIQILEIEPGARFQGGCGMLNSGGIKNFGQNSYGSSSDQADETDKKD